MNNAPNRIEVEKNESKSHPILVLFKILEFRKQLLGVAHHFQCQPQPKIEKGVPGIGYVI